MPRRIDHRGSRLAYEIQGQGPPVLLIQGVGVHGNGWRPQVEALSNRYTCLTFDNRGMGESQPAGGPVTVEQMAEDAVALLDAEGWGSAHVIGHSLGGLVALELALAARQRVRSLALLCTFAGGRDAAPPTPRMIWIGLRTRVGTRRMRRRAFLQLVMAPGTIADAEADELAERLVPLFGHDLADQPPIVGKQLAAMRAYDATPRLGELAGLPSLVVNAVHDPIAPPSAGRVLAGIPGSRYVELADASHGVPIQFPDRINTLLIDHLAAISPASEPTAAGRPPSR
jgi:pimeloyl-ACP methyl ester carboxylesterase